MKVAGLLEDYMTYLCVTKDHTRATIDDYIGTLGRFIQFAPHLPIEGITLRHVSAYQHWLLDNYPMARNKNRFAKHIIVLKDLLRFAERQGYKVLPAAMVDVPKEIPSKVNFLYPDEVKRMLKAAKNPRDKLIIRLLFDAGLRVHELTSLGPTQVRYERRQAVVVGKGSKTRVVFFTAATAALLASYFAEHDGIGVTDRTVQRIVRELGRKAGIRRKVTPHIVGRHSLATSLLNSGADLRSVQAILGHSNVLTTQIYTHIANPALRRTYRKAKPTALAGIR